MASKELSELEEIFEHIKNKKNFLLSGGAGSGKTFSLVAVINKIMSTFPNAKIACITYTNAAADEIKNRLSYNNIRISTIHDFLWDIISPFQKELKETLIEGINESESAFKNIHVDTPYSNEFADGIKYTEHLSIDKGNISHDEVIVLACKMFAKYIKLCNIVNCQYDFILVDEYQDTSPYVVNILLDSLSKTDKKSIIGFFGDSMQAIYDDGVGDINEYIQKGFVMEVKKEQNRRNPQSVIDLSNILRLDELKQAPSDDEKAPNMENGKVKQGNVKFLYGKIESIDDLKQRTYFNEWDFTNPEETKELRLTHNLIANTAGFSKLMEIYDKDPLLKLKSNFIAYIKKNSIDVDDSHTFDYVMKSIDWRYSGNAKIKEHRNKKYIDVFLEDTNNSRLYDIVKDKPFGDVRKIYFDKDCLIADKKEDNENKSSLSKRDKLIRHLFKIQNIITLYENKQYNDFLRKTSFRITNASDKKVIQEKIKCLIDMKSNTIQEIIEYANESNLCIKDDNINNFIASNFYLYSRVANVPYSEFISLYNYLEGYTPFSTQHKIKGEQYKNVLIILDNGEWSKYNFEYLLNPNHPKCNQNVLERTQKLFYVCCTRAMENLVVFCAAPTPEMINTAQIWFGKENCIPLCT
ncbi:MAG: ATP-dependent helicase [Oscillospiraceae bacterium]|nr:ATP-dependent helicase [Oscillospiraceae bacterium]